jgi:DNA-binding response OmpR family regulator
VTEAHPHQDLPAPQTVLLVEDDAAVRDSFMKGLVGHGFDILEAASGDEAIRLCQRANEAIPVAIVDMAMPQMWGDDLARRLADLNPQMKVIFVSGHSEQFLRGLGALTGNEVFFAKPFSLALLLKKVRETLGIENPAVLEPEDASSATEDPQAHIAHLTEHPELHMETDQHVD